MVSDYKMTKMDHLIIQLSRLGDDDFVEEVLEIHSVMDYDVLPYDVEERVSDILHERLHDVWPEEIKA